MTKIAGHISHHKENFFDFAPQNPLLIVLEDITKKDHNRYKD